ncbi:MAG: VCBS repeat domain-containing M23 family metallopeptidase [Kofleriaceae bacterium]|nr:VCBS repeat domain-containing M23 family metallopeptidase [Kofleriaceae bacterium]
MNRKIYVSMFLATVLGACADDKPISDDADGSEVNTSEATQAVSCSPRLRYYPVRGRHNHGYDSTAGNSSLWTCDDDHSWTDFAAGDHLGNDIWAAEGTPVVATVSGTLVLTGWSNYSGNKVTIADGCGWYHFYAHLKSIAPGMVNGRQVTAGEVIGTVGRTGTESNGVIHLHYSIYPAGNYNAGIDPWPYTHPVEQDVCNLPGTADDATPGDVNGDGRADLVSLSSNGNTYTWLGTATGGFSNAVADGGNTFDSALADGTGHLVVGVADVDGDRRADLVTVYGDGNAYVYKGTSSGAWGTRTSSFNGTMALAMMTGSGHDPIAVADVTGDGRADLITHATNGNVYVYPGTSSGSFGGGVASGGNTFDSAFRDGLGHWFVGAADVNGDGRADLVSVHSNGTAYVYLGTSSGAFGTRVDSFAGTMSLATVDGLDGHVPVGVADVDGDGRADLVTHHTNGTVYVYRGTSTGAFSGGVPSFAGTMAMGQFGAAGHQVVGVLDITGDGKADLVTVLGGSVYVYRGSSTGAFSGVTVNFAGTLDSSFGDDIGHELVQMGPFPRRRPCPATGCRAL